MGLFLHEPPRPGKQNTLIGEIHHVINPESRVASFPQSIWFEDKDQGTPGLENRAFV